MQGKSTFWGTIKVGSFSASVYCWKFPRLLRIFFLSFFFFLHSCEAPDVSYKTIIMPVIYKEFLQKLVFLCLWPVSQWSSIYSQTNIKSFVALKLEVVWGGGSRRCINQCWLNEDLGVCPKLSNSHCYFSPNKNLDIITVSSVENKDLGTFLLTFKGNGYLKTSMLNLTEDWLRKDLVKKIQLKICFIIDKRNNSVKQKQKVWSTRGKRTI